MLLDQFFTSTREKLLSQKTTYFIIFGYFTKVMIMRFIVFPFSPLPGHSDLYLMFRSCNQSKQGGYYVVFPNPKPIESLNYIVAVSYLFY